MNKQHAIATITNAEKLSAKFPKTFEVLRRGTTYMHVSHLWNDMQAAGITEDNLPAMEASINSEGFKYFQQFAEYFG